MSEAELSYTPDYVFIETEEEARRALAEMSKYPILAVDTETTGLDPYTSALLLLQIATADKCYILNCVKVDASVWAPVLSNKDILKLMHNAVFDYKVLKVHAGVSSRPIFDTMVAEQLIVAGRGLRVGLAPTVSRHLGVTLDKGVRSDFIGVIRDAFREEELVYAAKDALILHELYRRQIELLQLDSLTSVAQLEFDTVIPVAEMELAGVQIDIDKWRGLVGTATAYKKTVEAKLRELFLPVASQVSIFGDTAINFSSQKILLEHLNKLGIKSRGKPLEDTSDETLKGIDHPIGDLLREWRKWEKICSSYGSSLLNKINPVTGRLHAKYNQLRAGTGRMSSSDPNAQQIPGYNAEDPTSLNFRGCFIAKPGYKLVTADYSQQELRILAALSGDESFIQAYKNNEDLHTRTAINVFGGTPDEVKANGNRKVAKAINFLLSYGGSAFTLANRLGISEDEAQKLMNDYFNAFPGVKTYMDTAASFAVEHGYSLTVSGRRRYFDIPDKSHPEYNKIIGAVRRKGMNTPIQGCLTKDARILTINGYMSIEDILSADEKPSLVWTGTTWEEYKILHMGKWRRASIILDDGTKIPCDTRHKVLSVSDDGYNWVEFNDIQPNMKIAVSMPQSAVCLSDNGFDETSTSYDLWWWVGAHKSIGEVNEDGSIIYIFGQESQHIVQKCISFWSSFDAKTSVSVEDDTGVYIVVLSNSKIKSLFEDGIFSLTEIPHHIFALPPGSKQAFMDGFTLFYSPQNSFLSSNLLHDLRLLFRTIGVAYKVSDDMHPKLVAYSDLDYIPSFIRNALRASLKYTSESQEKQHLFELALDIVGGKEVDLSVLNMVVSALGLDLNIPLYSIRRVNRINVYDELVDTYTLFVNSKLHRFDCEGVITKNSAADVSKKALCNIFYNIEEAGLDASVIMIVHDELVCEAAEDQAEEVARLLEKSMIDGFTAYFKNVPMVVDACVDDTWHH